MPWVPFLITAKNKAKGTYSQSPELLCLELHLFACCLTLREATSTQNGRQFLPPEHSLILGEHLIGSATHHLSNQLWPGGSWLCPVTEANQDFLRGSNAESSQRPTLQGWPQM